jgi:hypothetical protein
VCAHPRTRRRIAEIAAKLAALLLGKSQPHGVATPHVAGKRFSQLVRRAAQLREGRTVTEQELKRARAVHRALSVRLYQIKSRLRVFVVEEDCLGLGGKNFAVLMRTNVEKMRGFRYCFACIATQVLDGFLRNTAKLELAAIFEPMATVLSVCAEHAIKKHMTPANTSATALIVPLRARSPSLRVVLTPPAALTTDAMSAPRRAMNAAWRGTLP